MTSRRLYLQWSNNICSAIIFMYRTPFCDLKQLLGFHEIVEGQAVGLAAQREETVFGD